MIFKGRVTKSTPEVGGTTQAGKDWVRQDFVIEETSGEYPNSIVATNFNNKVQIKEGDEGDFHINTRVNEYNGKFYNALNLWKIETAQGEQAPQQEPEDLNQGTCERPF